MTTVAKTRVTKSGDEYVVKAYSADGKRLADCDYFTDCENDAYNTASYMLAGLSVADVFTAPAYRRVNAEDGAFEAYAGDNVIAKIVDADGHVHSFVYAGPTGGMLPYLFTSGIKAAAFVERVKAAGRINAAAYWFLADVRDPNELPDYVVNPHRPEYN
jgi:hypothetical protein